MGHLYICIRNSMDSNLHGNSERLLWRGPSLQPVAWLGPSGGGIIVYRIVFTSSMRRGTGLYSKLPAEAVADVLPALAGVVRADLCQAGMLVRHLPAYLVGRSGPRVPGTARGLLGCVASTEHWSSM